MEDNIISGFQKDGGMNWINLTRDKDKWQALVNMVMNNHVPHIMRGMYCITEELSDSQEVLRSTD